MIGNYGCLKQVARELQVSTDFFSRMIRKNKLHYTIDEEDHRKKIVNINEALSLVELYNRNHPRAIKVYVNGPITVSNF